MDNFTLTSLKERFDQELAQTNKVVLDQRVLRARKNLDFIVTLLGEQIVLTNVRAILDQTASPGKLTVTGNPETDWMIPGVYGAGMTAVSVSLVYEGGTSGASDSAMMFEGVLTIGEQPVPCSGSLAEEGKLEFGLKEAQAIRLPLQAAADFVTGSRMTANYLPAGVELFTTIPITAIELSFGLSYTAPTWLCLTSEVGGPWKFIEGIDLQHLEKVGIRLFTRHVVYPNLHFRTSYGGDIHAYFVLAGHELEVRLALNPTDVWEIALAPRSGGTLPSLLDLAIALGVKESVQMALNALGLGDISVLGISIGFNLQARKLLYVSIAGRVQVAGKDFDLWIRLPDFQFGGGLARGASISFRQIAEYFFKAADNKALPDVIVEEFSLAAQPSAGRYSLMVDLREEGFTLGPVTLEGLNLSIEKTPQGFDGSMTAALAIAGATLYISAKHPGPDAGWQFSGSTGPGQKIPIGTLIADLVELFGNDIREKLPPAIADLTIEDLGVTFDTKTSNFSFTCKAQFPVDKNAKVAISVTIDLTHENGVYKKDFGGRIEINLANEKEPLVFKLEFVEEKTDEKTADLFIATYPGGGRKLKVGDLMRAIVQGNPDWTRALDGIEIELKDALFAFSKTGDVKKFLFGLDIGAKIALADLPLVGKEFPDRRTAGIDDLQVLVASRSFSAAEVETLNGLLPDKVTRLPDISKSAGAQTGSQDKTKIVALKQGLNVGATLQLGDATRSLSLPVAAGGSSTSNSGSTSTSTTTAQSTAADDNALWFKIQKSLGPVHFERVGAQYRDGKIWFLLDAALGVAGLTLSLNGLSAGSHLNKFDPEFDLRGLGIDYRNQTLEIGGAFLKIADKEYGGAAVLRVRQLTLSALGMYKEMADKEPSLFIYAELDYPIGGPAFFFVTGLAAGFGYSRRLKMPAIEDVAKFSLVENACGSGAGMPKDLTAEMQRLAKDISPAAGEHFLAIGLKFTSFKVVETFALLGISFGSHFELNLLGLSNLSAPANAGEGIPPVARAQLALKGSFQPDKGFLAVQAQLTPGSYLLSEKCSLTGGFAFFCWFAGSEHDGDFVLTLGGYHPLFRAPAHYPVVPRLGVNWQVIPQLNLNGDAYFALTASALMVGGHLEANWRGGPVHAWFKVGADFLIAWKPYHYDISVYVSLGAEVTFELFGTQHITVEIGANLHIWGPEFSGEATIHLWIISFTISFGAGAALKPEAIKWPEFKTSFLPAEKDVCSIAVADGLIGKESQDASHLGAINPRHFALLTNSVIPLTAAQFASKDEKRAIAMNKKPGRFGIASMAVAAEDLTSTLTITIKRDGEYAGKDFEYTPVFKNVPAGLWGESPAPDLTGKKQFIENALAGFEIRPKKPPDPGETNSIERIKLQAKGYSAECEFSWESVKSFTAAAFKGEPQRREELRKQFADKQSADNRKALLAALGFKPDDPGKLSLDASLADDFLFAPQIEK
jgi:hypothetical protein